jgi:sialic acid synthase SpsE
MQVMRTLQQAFGLPVGYSDHSKGVEASVLSIAFGAKVIEKHFTLDKNLPGPDHGASSNPKEFAQLVTCVRRVEKMLGSPIKDCRDEEKDMAKVSRKSIALAKDLKEDEIIRLEHLTLLRPGTGLSPKYINDILGFRVKKYLRKGTLLTWNELQ